MAAPPAVRRRTPAAAGATGDRSGGWDRGGGGGGGGDRDGDGDGRGDGGPGGWWMDEPELHLGEDVLVPDLAGWRRERMPELPAAGYFEPPPDWVCEVISPSTARTDRVGKVPVYARAGVIHLWLIDPLARTLEVCRLEQGRWVLLATHADDERVRAEPFETVELELARLWGREA